MKIVPNSDKCPTCGFQYRLCSDCKTIYCAKCEYGSAYASKVSNCPTCNRDCKKTPRTFAASHGQVQQYLR